MNTGDIDVVQQIDKFEEISDIFIRRAKRKEFATIKYVIYLQYAAFFTQDRELLEGIIRYGFDELFDKLRWLDRVTALEYAVNLEPALPYLSKIFDKTACQVLYSEYNEFN